MGTHRLSNSEVMICITDKFICHLQTQNFQLYTKCKVMPYTICNNFNFKIQNLFWASISENHFPPGATVKVLTAFFQRCALWVFATLLSFGMLTNHPKFVGVLMGYNFLKSERQTNNLYLRDAGKPSEVLKKTHKATLLCYVGYVTLNHTHITSTFYEDTEDRKRKLS
jgi:hypothetical protein